jgi:hypothetical protein
MVTPPSHERDELLVGLQPQKRRPTMGADGAGVL